MTLDQLREWVAEGESETVEFKRTTGERREGAQSLCAMLNHRGGRVLFGVAADGTIVGQDVTDRTVEDVAQEIRELDPPAYPSVERVAVGGGKQVIVVTVSQGQGRPYSYRGIAYKRVGNTSTRMLRDEYNRILLERLHGDYRWENQPASGWTVRDLDISELTRTVDEAIRRSRAEDPGTRDPTLLLQGLGLIRDGQLLRAAAVLFGRAEPLEAEYPQCMLRVARFRGTDKTEFLDNRQFHGNAFDLLRRAERFLVESLPKAGRIVPGLFERIDDPLYPPRRPAGSAGEWLLPSGLQHRRWLRRPRHLRRPAGSHLVREPPLRPDHRGTLPPARITPLESPHCARLLPTRHHRAVGARHPENRGTGSGGGAAHARDRGQRRRRHRPAPTEPVPPPAARRP